MKTYEVVLVGVGSRQLADSLAAWLKSYVPKSVTIEVREDDDGCCYQCPFTREGHEAMEVDHDFVAKEASVG